MTSHDDGSVGGPTGGSTGGPTDPPGPGNGLGPSWWEDDAVKTQRVRDQVDIVVRGLGRDRVHVAKLGGDRIHNPDDFGNLGYMYQQGRILVRDGDLPRALDALRRDNGAAGAGVVEGGINGMTLLEVDSAQAALTRLDRSVGARVGYPDHVLYVSGLIGSACPAVEPLPTDEREPLPTREADSTSDGHGVKVAVVDTGFDKATADGADWLLGVEGEQESVDPDDLAPYVGHGTFVAGIVRAMAPRAEVSVESFLPHGGAIFESEISRQLQDAILGYPDIISISAGSQSRANHGLLSFSVLWEQLAPKGTVLIAAAGNDGDRIPFYPAAAPYAVSVGAVDADRQRAAYSNHGSWVDVYARGSDVVNAFPCGTYRYREPPRVGQTASFTSGLAKWSGTSFAAPIVAGLVAARMTWSGENGRQAARSLRKIARKHAQVGVGAVVEPWMACRP